MSGLEIKNSTDSAELVELVLHDLHEFVANALSSNTEVHISLTGGRIGTEISKNLLADQIIDSPLVHLWWSDERFLPTGDPDRNDSVIPANFAFATKLHQLPSADNNVELTEAVQDAQAQLHLNTTARFCATNDLMDISLLSVGPDGHVASLFPGHSALKSSAGIVGLTDSPKPPAQRITWTYPTINASRQVWLIAAGSEKAQAVQQLVAGADLNLIPAAGVHGKNKTVLYTEKSALPN
jgi:6-phosphogluconolactonase